MPDQHPQSDPRLERPDGHFSVSRRLIASHHHGDPNANPSSVSAPVKRPEISPINPDLHQPILQVYRPAVSGWRVFRDIFRTSTATFNDTIRQYRIKRLRVMWRALTHFCVWRYWHGFLLSSPLAAIGRHHPRFYEKPFRPYLHRNLSRADCYRLLREHYLFLQQHAPPEFIAALIENRPFILNELSIAGLKSPLFVNLGYARHMRQEGELTLSVGTLESHNSAQQHEWIASLTFIIHYGASGWEILVGGVQGGHPGGKGRDDAKLATRAFHGMRPKFLLIDMLQQIASCWHISRIYAVGDDAHVFQRRRYRNRINIRSSYNDLWTEAGGVPAANGFFLLPREAHRKSTTEIQSHKRAEYQRRYQVIDSIHQEIRDKLGIRQTQD